MYLCISWRPSALKESSLVLIFPTEWKLGHSVVSRMRAHRLRDCLSSFICCFYQQCFRLKISFEKAQAQLPDCKGFAHGYFRLGSSLFYLWNLKLFGRGVGNSGKAVLFHLQWVRRGESPLGFTFNTKVSLSSVTVWVASPYSDEEVHLKSFLKLAPFSLSLHPQGRTGDITRWPGALQAHHQADGLESI